MTVCVLLLAALLDPGDVVRWARTLPEGWQRTGAVAATRWVPRLSEDLLLDRPRQAIEELLGRDTRAPQRGTRTPRTPRFRAPTPGRPLRVYIGGDSVLEAVGKSFERMSVTTGVIDTTLEYRFSTGLTRPDYFDWPARLKERVDSAPRPEVVIVMFGANDLQSIRTPHGYAAVGSAAWLAEYRSRVASTMRLLAASGADVYWVGQPIMRDPAFSARMRQLDSIFSTEAATTPGVTYVDTWSLLADRAGHYSAYLAGPSGQLELMRTADGVHLTPAGGDRVAALLLRLIAKRWPFRT